MNRLLLGWLCTLDVYGYDYKQLLVVPFMIIHKLIKDMIYHPNGRTDSRIQNVFQMIRTTKQIIKNNNLKIDVIFDSYKNPEQRTVDYIKNNKILLAQMLFTRKPIEEITSFIFNVFEEEVRRFFSYADFCKFKD